MSSDPEAVTVGVGLAQVANYFRSPAMTLAESLKDENCDLFSHDLMDAYATLLIRLRDIAPVLAHGDSDVPALAYISDNSVAIAQCLRRDTRRALINPFSDLPQDTAIATAGSQVDHVGKEGLQAAKNSASLCHSALRTISYILQLPALSAIFPMGDITQISNSVIDILQSPVLYTPNERKTWALAIWVLSNGRLPATSVAARRTQIAAVLRETIKDSTVNILISDSLRALGSLLQFHPTLFTQPCTITFPSSLAQLTSESETVRMEAAYALGSYASTLVFHPTSPREAMTGPIRRSLKNFIDAAAVKRSKSSDTGFVSFVTDALACNDKSQPGQRAVWAQVVLASIVTIFGEDIFTHSATLKFIMRALHQSAHHRRPVVRALHTLVWRCLVWALSQLQYEAENSRTAHDDTRGDQVWDTRARALAMIKQERRGGLGKVLIGTILASAPSHSSASGDNVPECRHVSEVMAIMRDMAEDEDSFVQSETRAILARLTSGVGSARSPPTTLSSDRGVQGALIKELFDGTILRLGDAGLSALLPSLDRYNVDGIRPLSEAEITGGWDRLVDVWSICVRNFILETQTTTCSTPNLLETWQALLLVQAQLTQEYRHLTTAPECASRVVRAFEDILALQGDLATGARTNNETASRILGFVSQAWKVARAVFNTSWLSTVAERVLGVTLQHTYDLADERIVRVWADVCGALVLAGAPDLLHRLVVASSSRQEIQLMHHLWTVLVKLWTSSDPLPNLKIAASLLTLPIGLFPLCDDVLKLWEDLFAHVVTGSAPPSVPLDQVLDTVAARFIEQSERLSNSPCIANALLLHFRQIDGPQLPQQFLKLVNSFLLDLYASKPENLNPALDAIQNLSTLSQTCPQHLIVSLVSALSDGLCIWIRDEAEVLLEEEYNTFIMHLYQTTLDRLASYSFTLDTLMAMSPFLASAFKRMVYPAHGPLAFKSFWDNIHPFLSFQLVAFPDDFKQALKLNHDLYGGALPSDLSHDFESQSQSQSQDESIVPETPSSQPNLMPLCLPPPVADELTDIGPLTPSKDTASRVPGRATSLPTSCSPGDGDKRTERARTATSNTSSFDDDKLSPGVLYGGNTESVRMDRSFTSPNRSSTNIARASSTVVSPEVPFLPQPKDRGGGMPSQSRRGNSEPSHVVPGPSPSFSVPSSLTSGKHRSSLTLDPRPHKKARVEVDSSSPANPRETSLALAGPSPNATPHKSQPPKAGPNQRSTRRTKKERLVFDGVVVPRLRDLESWRAIVRGATPQTSLPRSPYVSEGYEHQKSPYAQDDPSYGDYDTWEANIDPDEALRIQQELDRSPAPPDDEAEMTSSQIADNPLYWQLTPVAQRSRVLPSVHGGSANLEDTLVVPGPAGQDVVQSSQDDDIFSQPCRPAPARSETVQCLLVSSSGREQPESSLNLRRSHTTSERLELLRKARDVMRENGSQMPEDAIAEAADLLDDMHCVVRRWRRTLLGDGAAG